MPCHAGVAVVFDDDDDKDEDSDLDEVQSGDEEDEGEEMGVDARKGRSLRGEEGEEEDVDELSVQDVDAHWLQRWAGWDGWNDTMLFDAPAFLVVCGYRCLYLGLDWAGPARGNWRPLAACV